MLDKYFYLMILIAANSVGKTSEEFNISYVQNLTEWTTDGMRPPGNENVSIVLTKKEGTIWNVKDLNTNRLGLMDISESEMVLKDKNPIRLKFDWLDFKKFDFKKKDTLYYKENMAPIFEVRQSKKQKLMEIRLLPEEKAQEINHFLIQY